MGIHFLAVLISALINWSINSKFQVRLRESFFSVFYITINIGSLTSMIVTPILRELPCLGNDTCYPLAFGTPAMLFVVAIIVFVLGTPMYKRSKVTGESVLMKGFGAVKLATQNRVKYGKSYKRFLYHADAKYDVSMTSVFCDRETKLQ